MKRKRIKKVVYLSEDDYALVSYLSNVLKVSESSSIRLCVKLVRDWCVNNRLDF